MVRRSGIAIIPLALSLVAATGSCSPLSADTSCFKRSHPVLPAAEKVRPYLNNGEEGRAVYDAVVAGDIDAVERMIRANPRLLETHRVLADGERPSNGNAGGLLAFAIARCDARMLGALLELGVDPDGTPPGVALTYALLADDPLMATMLLQAGANPDAHRTGGSTPLREVLYYERSDAVELLVRAGADVNHSDEVGITPLLSALRFGDYRSARALMEGGANPWLVSNKGELPAAILQEEAQDKGQDPIRQQLLDRARRNAPSWPPPDRAEIVRQFASGAWPTDAMRSAGFIASEGALQSIRLVARKTR